MVLSRSLFFEIEARHERQIGDGDDNKSTMFTINISISGSIISSICTGISVSISTSISIINIVLVSFLLLLLDHNHYSCISQ